MPQILENLKNMKSNKTFGGLFYIIAAIIVMVVIYYGSPHLYNYCVKDNETYAPNRERSDLGNDWSIVNEIRKIRDRQRINIGRFSQGGNYNI